MKIIEFQKGDPSRQNFYEVKLVNGDEIIAEWRELSKKDGKRWWQYTSEDPTIEKTPVALEGVTGFRPVSKDAVAAMLRRELTHQEKIERSLHDAGTRYLRHASEDDPEVPESRILKVGDELVYGNLDDCVVVATHVGNRLVTLTCTRELRQQGQVVSTGTDYMTVGWFSLNKKTTEQPEHLFKGDQYISVNYSNSDLTSLLHRMEPGAVTDAPDYQRGYVWTDADKEAYLEAIFEGRELGRFVFVKYGYPRVTELLDGKQRLNTIWDFYCSRIAYKGVYWHQLSRYDRHKFKSRSVQYADLNGEQYTRLQLLQTFKAINAGGVPQTKEHLAHVDELIALEEAKVPVEKLT